MRTARRITHNFLSLSVAELTSKFIQLVIFVYIARIYGKSEFGIFGFAVAFSAIIAIFADFGINTLLIREISRNKSSVKKYVSNALTFKLFLSAFTIVASIILIYFFDKNKSLSAATILMVIFVVLQSYTDLFYSVFRAFERMYYDSSIKISRMIILLFLIYISITNGASLVATIAMFPITELVILVMSLFIYLKNFAKLSFKFDMEFGKGYLKELILFGLSMTFASILLYVDTIILELVRGQEEVGIYSAAYNLLLGVTFIPLMFSNAIFPVFSRYFIKDKSLLKFAYKKAFQYMFILGLPITIGIFIYARNIVLLAYGVEYARSIIATKILCWFILLRFINITSGTLLSSVNRQGARVFGQGTVAILNILLNIILIPKLGFIGAGIATIASESFFLLTYYYFIFKENLNFDFLGVLVKPVIASIIMIAIILNIPNLFIGATIGCISYTGMLFALKTFKSEDNMLLMRILKNQ